MFLFGTKILGQFFLPTKIFQKQNFRGNNKIFLKIVQNSIVVSAAVKSKVS